MLLGPEVLDDRLEHQLAVLQLREVGHRPDPTQDRLGVRGGELALLDLAPERLADLGAATLGRLQGSAADGDIEAGFGGHLSYTRSHDA